MPKRVLIQLDGDAQPSTFDSIVAIDAGVDVLLRHGEVTVDGIVPLVHGAMFTRGGGDLAATAIFIGGSDVARAEEMLRRVRETFFGPVRVGVLLDPAGANTTAAAAVLAATRHAPIVAGERCGAVVLGGTGPVGQRVARLLARGGAEVTLVSRSAERAEAVAARIRTDVAGATVRGIDDASLAAGGATGALATARIVVAAGAAGVTLLDERRRRESGAAVFIDLNAVPPAGIEGVAAADKGRGCGAAVCYGALGVGGLKMKIHRAAIDRLFAPDAPVLDAEELLAIGAEL